MARRLQPLDVGILPVHGCEVMLEEIKEDTVSLRSGQDRLLANERLWCTRRDAKIFGLMAFLTIFCLILTDHSVSRAENPSTSVDTPAQSRQKAEEAARTGRTSFWVVRDLNDSLDEKASDLMRPGSKTRPYEFIGEDGRVEVIVDKAGSLYKDRKYKGVIPGIRATTNPRSFARSRGESTITWVGFQPKAAISRIFWVLTNPSPHFHVDRIDATTVDVTFPKTKIKAGNTIRGMNTQHFGGPVAYVVGKKVKKGIRYRIKLKRPANYLFRHEAPYLYVDFER